MPSSHLPDVFDREHWERFIESIGETISNPWTVAASLAVLLVGYNGLYRLFFSSRRLPEHVYHTSSIVVGALSDPQFAIALLGPSTLLLLGWRHTAWDTFEHPRLFRALALLLALPMLWTFVPYEFNYYLDQPHHADRALLIVLFALIWVHPGFVVPFLLILLAVIGQFFHPFGHFSESDKLLPLNLLTLFSAFLFFKLRHEPHIQHLLEWTHLDEIFDPELNDEKVFVWAAAGLIGGSYFVPAVSKMQLLWPLRETVHYYIPLKYIRGWLGHLSRSAMLDIYAVMKVLNPVAVWTALAIETSAVALMWRKRGMAVITGAITMLHLLIFSASGIFFWKWIIALWVFLAFVYYLDQRTDWPVFSRKTAVIVTVLILLSPFIFQATPLAWYTKNYDHVYTVEAVDSAGNVHDVHWSEFEPYPAAHTVSANRFDYIHSEPVLGGSDYETVTALRNADSKQDIERLKAERGVVECTPTRAENFDRFITRYFNTYTERDAGSMWATVPTLPHFWNTEQTEPLPRDREYQHVQIRMTEYLVADDDLKQFDSTIVRVIPLNNSSAASQPTAPLEKNSC